MITHADGRPLDDHPAVGSGRAEGLAVLGRGVARAPPAAARGGRPGHHPSRRRGSSAGTRSLTPRPDGSRAYDGPEISRPGVPVLIIAIIVVVVIVVLLVLYVVLTYNRLVRTRNQIDNAYSQIDVQLKRRYDLIPNLVETVKGYAAHEKSTFEAVTNARANAIQAQQGSSPAQQAQAENVLSGALKSLFAVAEAYPDLKANQNFLNLQEELTSTEDRIAYARQFYNDSVLGYNNRIQSFPGNLIAGIVQLHAPRVLRGRPRGDGPGQGPVLGPAASVGHCHGDVRADRAEQAPHLRDARRAFVLLIALVAVALGFLFQAGVVIVPIAILIAIALAWASYFYSDKVALAASRAKPADGPEYRRYHNLVEGLMHRRGPAEAAPLRGRRPGAERVRHRSQPEARRARGHHRPAREDEPGRARGRARPRAQPREELRHPRVDRRGHRGRRGGADGRPRHAVPVVRRPLRPAGQQRLGPARADPRDPRVRAADPRSRSPRS